MDLENSHNIIWIIMKFQKPQVDQKHLVDQKPLVDLQKPQVNLHHSIGIPYT